MLAQPPTFAKIPRLRRSWRLLSVLTGAVAVLSCGEPAAPSDPGAVQASLTTSPPNNASKRASKTVRNVRLARCQPMSPVTATKQVGTAGGTLEVGAHTLYIPPGALQGEVIITAVAPSDTMNLIHFEPEGLQFRKPAVLTMSYRNCSVTGPVKVEIAYLDDNLALMEYLLSVDRATRVTGLLKHFSNYAVAY